MKVSIKHRELNLYSIRAVIMYRLGIIKASKGKSPKIRLVHPLTYVYILMLTVSYVLYKVCEALWEIAKQIKIEACLF